MEWVRDNLTVTDDLAKFDMDFVVSALQSTWRKGAPGERIQDAFANSLCLGLFDGDRQVGCVRAVTDREFVSWVCDMFLNPAYRGRKLGQWLIECAKNHPDLLHTRLVFSSVPESQAFYERMGFRPMDRGYSMPPRRRERGAEDDPSSRPP